MDPSQLYETYSEMFQIVRIRRHRLCETFSNFYHGLQVWYHDFIANITIFRLCFRFLRIFKSFGDIFVVFDS